MRLFRVLYCIVLSQPIIWDFFYKALLQQQFTSGLLSDFGRLLKDYITFESPIFNTELSIGFTVRCYPLFILRNTAAM